MNPALADRGADLIQYAAAPPRLNPEEFRESPDPEAYVPVELWGKDHWSTFAYVETRDRERGEKLNPENMRCHPRLHRQFATQRGPSGAGYPTRLKDDIELERHDDWACLEDMSAHGLAVAFFQNRTRSDRPWQSEMKCRAFLTEKGSALADQLLAFKREGGNYHEFEPDLEKIQDFSEKVPNRASEYTNE